MVKGGLSRGIHGTTMDDMFKRNVECGGNWRNDRRRRG